MKTITQRFKDVKIIINIHFKIYLVQGFNDISIDRLINTLEKEEKSQFDL